MSQSAVTNCPFCGMLHSHCICKVKPRDLIVPVYWLKDQQPKDGQICQTAGGSLKWNASLQRFMEPNTFGVSFGHFTWWASEIRDIQP